MSCSGRYRLISGSSVSAAERQFLRKTPLVGRVWKTVFISLLVIPRAHLRWYVLCYQMLYIGFFCLSRTENGNESDLKASRLQWNAVVLPFGAVILACPHCKLPVEWLFSRVSSNLGTVTDELGHHRFRQALVSFVPAQRFSFGNTKRVCRQKCKLYFVTKARFYVT